MEERKKKYKFLLYDLDQSRSDSVKLTLSLGNDKERVFMAEVAWADVPSAQKERLGVGLRFVATK